MPVEWEEMQSASEHMFRIWAGEGDLAFAKECWDHFVAAGLASNASAIDGTETRLRLLALRLIYGKFCAAKWDESADQDVVYLAEGLQLDRLALGLLAFEPLADEAWQFEAENELYEAALIAVTDRLRAEVFDCIRKAYGGTYGLYRRMSRSTGSGDDEAIDDPTRNNLAAYQALDEEL